MSEPVLREIRLREALATAERERDEAKEKGAWLERERDSWMHGNRRTIDLVLAALDFPSFTENNGCHISEDVARVVTRMKAAESRASAAEALLWEAAEVIDKLADHPRYWDGFYESARDLLARIKEAIYG